MSAPTDLVIEAEQLTRRFGDRVAVDHLDFAVARGSITGFLGPNGAGKTTTIRMLLGLITPTSGRVRVCGVDVFGPDAAAQRPSRRVGAIVETPAAYLSLSAFDNLRVFALSSGLDVDAARIAAVLARVGLTGREREPVRGFSLGMKQRLGLAASLVHDPEVLFLDEPMNGLDPAGIVEMRVLLKRLAAEGKTIFVSSHALLEVQQTCTDVVVVAKGRKRYAGPIAGLLGAAHLKVRATDPVAALSALSQAFADVSLTREGDDIIARLDPARAPQVTRALVAANVDVLAIEPRTTDFERSFFAATTDAVDDTANSTGAAR